MILFRKTNKTNEKSTIFQVLVSEVGSTNRLKIKVFLGIAPETPPTRPQDAPKVLQDAPRHFKDGPRPPRGRARTAPRRPQTAQDGSKMAPRGARDGPRRSQIREKKRPKRDPKRNPLQTQFLERFQVDFGSFGVDLGWFWG